MATAGGPILRWSSLVRVHVGSASCGRSKSTGDPGGSRQDHRRATPSAAVPGPGWNGATKRWNIVALDLDVDLSSPHGEFMASVMAAISRWERRVIGQRTAKGLAAAKVKGILPGHRSRLDPDVRVRIVKLRQSGLSLSKVADRLNADQVTTVSGRSWKSTQPCAASPCNRPPPKPEPPEHGVSTVCAPLGVAPAQHSATVTRRRDGLPNLGFPRSTSGSG